MGKIVIRVPATSARVGNNINPFSVAFQLYTTVIVEEETDHWIVNHSLKGVPHDSDNLIVQAILRVNPRIVPHQLTVMSDIPRISGLGYRTSFIIAGIKIANTLGKMHLSQNDQINLGYHILGQRYRGIAVGILGGFTISSLVNNHVLATKVGTPQEPVLMLIYVMRGKLPSTPSATNLINKKLIRSSNALIITMMDHDWDRVSKIMGADTKSVLVSRNNYKTPDFRIILQNAHRLGIDGVYIDQNEDNSVMFAFGMQKKIRHLYQQMRNNSKIFDHLWLLKIDLNGASVRGE